ncbi:MAG: DUF1629 domain-containing protein [Pseudomonadota bacterium]
MAQKIWMCDTQKKLESQKKVESDWFADEAQWDKLTASRRANEAGKVLARHDFPPSIYGQASATERDYDFPDVFVVNAQLVVSDRFTEVMDAFDFGSGSLLEVPHFKKDKTTPIPGKWFFLNFGNAKNAFVPEQSERIRKIEGTEFWTIKSFQKPDNLAFNASALEGPDIWVEPKCPSVFFMSDRLYSAIRKAKLQGFTSVRCKIV